MVPSSQLLCVARTMKVKTFLKIYNNSFKPEFMLIWWWPCWSTIIQPYLSLSSLSLHYSTTSAFMLISNYLISMTLLSCGMGSSLLGEKPALYSESCNFQLIPPIPDSGEGWRLNQCRWPVLQSTMLQNEASITSSKGLGARSSWRARYMEAFKKTHVHARRLTKPSSTMTEASELGGHLLISLHVSFTLS